MAACLNRLQPHHHGVEIRGPWAKQGTIHKVRENCEFNQELWTADIEDDLRMSLDAVIANC